jgi:hypothetical protein
MLTLTILATALLHGPSDCNATSKEPAVFAETPGAPFQALPTADGCWIFVSIREDPLEASR